MAKIDKVKLEVHTPDEFKDEIKSDSSTIGRTFYSKGINAQASMTLKGTPGENIGGWTLGFIQLKYLGTDRAHYRGATVKDGSIKFSRSNKTLCRDNDGYGELWYNGVENPYIDAGTNQLPEGFVLPQEGSYTIPAFLLDTPSRWWALARINTLVPGRPVNYLDYAVAELLFCTMLVAQEPTGKFHMLKHFYWSVVWELKFKHENTVVVNRRTVFVDKVIRQQQNVQSPRDGSPGDKRFSGKEYDISLPFSYIVTNRSPLIVQALDWSQG